MKHSNTPANKNIGRQGLRCALVAALLVSTSSPAWARGTDDRSRQARPAPRRAVDARPTTRREQRDTRQRAVSVRETAGQRGDVARPAAREARGTDRQTTSIRERVDRDAVSANARGEDASRAAPARDRSVRRDDRTTGSSRRNNADETQRDRSARARSIREPATRTPSVHRGPATHRDAMRARDVRSSLKDRLKHPHRFGNHANDSEPQVDSRYQDAINDLLVERDVPELPFGDVGQGGPGRGNMADLLPTGPDTSRFELGGGDQSGITPPTGNGNLPSDDDFGAGPGGGNLGGRISGAPQRGMDPAKHYAGQTSEGGDEELPDESGSAPDTDPSPSFAERAGAVARDAAVAFASWVFGVFGPPLPLDTPLTGPTDGQMDGAEAIGDLEDGSYGETTADLAEDDSEEAWNRMMENRFGPSKQGDPDYVDPNDPDVQARTAEIESNTHYRAIRDAARRQSRVNPNDHDDGSGSGNGQSVPDRIGDINKDFADPEGQASPRAPTAREFEDKRRRHSAQSSSGDGVINPGPDHVDTTVEVPLGGGQQGPGSGGNPAANDS